MVYSAVFNEHSNELYLQEYGSNRIGQYQTNELLYSSASINSPSSMKSATPMHSLSPMESSLSMQSSLPVSSSSLMHSSFHMHPSIQTHRRWYTGGYDHTQQSTVSPNYVNQAEHFWHQHAAAHSHNVLHHEFKDYLSTNTSSVQYPQHQTHSQNQIPSPTLSEVSSQSGKLSQFQRQNQSRPIPARSPFGWMKNSSYQTQPTPGKTRTKDKYRVVYSENQRTELEGEFMLRNKYLTVKRKSELAVQLGLSERQVKIWFQNRRAKERKQNKKKIEELNQHTLLQQDLNIHHQQQSVFHQNSNVLFNEQKSVLSPNAAVIQHFMDNSSIKLEDRNNLQL